MHMEISFLKQLGGFLGNLFQIPGVRQMPSVLSPSFYYLSCHSVFIILSVILFGLLLFHKPSVMNKH